MLRTGGVLCSGRRDKSIDKVTRRVSQHFQRTNNIFCRDGRPSGLAYMVGCKTKRFTKQ